MLGNLIARLWKDESGAVLAAEYLMLGSVVAVGGVTGLAAVRDGIVEEYKEYGASIRETRRAHSVPAPTPTPAAKPATLVVGGAVTTTAVQNFSGYTFGQP